MKFKITRQLLMLSKYAFFGVCIQAIAAGMLIAGDGLAQQKLQDMIVSVNFEEERLENVFLKIEKLSGLNFAYHKGLVPRSQKISGNFDETSLASLLLYISWQTDLKFKRIDNNIFVSVKDAQEMPVEEAQQGITITGKVISSDDPLGLPGVNILLKGTKSGTVSDVNGDYRIEVPGSQAILIFSSVGFVTEEVVVGNRTVIDLSLATDIKAMEEIVVIGYGEVKRSDLTGSVGSVKSEAISRGNPVQAVGALQGQVAGVNVNKNNSRPGSDYRIDIRGLQSIGFSNEPLVVIDGVMGGKLNTLNPSDIESMDVLKDASATAIYGARGANGVIIVTTKKGKEGKTKVTYDGYVGVKVPTHLPDLMTAQEFYGAYNDVVKAENPSANPVWTATELANVEAGNSVDWVDQITDPSPQTGHVIALSGGSEHATHYFSAGFLSENGNLLNTGYERFNLKGAIDSKLSEVVKVGFTAYYTYSILNLGSNESLRGAYRVRPTGSIYFKDLVNPSETNDSDVNGYAYWMGIKDAQVQNPILEVTPEYMMDETRRSSFLGNAYLEISPVKGLSYRSSLSTSVFNSRQGVYRGAGSKSRLNRLPDARTVNSLDGSYNWDNILTYKATIGLHNINLTAGHSALIERFELSNINVENLPYNSGWYALNTAPIINGVGSNLIERSILSFMGRINYIFNDKYLLTLTGRQDGSSVLAPGNKWAFFPSAAIAWRAGDETFVQNLNIFSDLKFRISYGEVGNDVVSPYSTQAYLRKTAYDFNGSPAYGYAPNNIGNAELKWENSSEINFGVNMGFVNNRISVDLELYNKKTNDLIQNVALPSSLGFSSVTANVGKLVNRGVEISLNTVNFEKKDFRWNTNINFSSNHNEILELYGGTVTRDIANSLFVGHSLRSNYYYKFDGIWQLDEADEAAKYGQVPGSVKVVDVVADGKISSAADADDRVVLGNELPKWIAGITNTITFKSWDLSFFIYTRQGVQFRNAMLQGTMGELGSNRYNRLNLNYWTAENPTNDYFGVWQPNPYRQAIQYKDASFWRISHITLGYNLPTALLEKIRFNNARLYLLANNPYLFTKDKNIWMDPEFNSGTYQDDVPNATYSVGINLSF